MKKITFLDIIIVLLFSLLIVFLLFNQFFGKKEGNQVLYIQTENSKYFYDLAQEKTIEINGSAGHTVIRIEKGKFRFLESACKNKDCVKSGWVGVQNFPVICLPNKVSAYIVDDKIKESEFDVISR